VSAAVWVNEQGALTDDDIAQIKATGTPLQEDTDSLGNRVALWVQWQSVTDLSTATGEARAYALDPVQGLVQFGDGQHGKVPPIGRDNIKADYDIGGGRAGNVGMGAITALRTTVAGIDRVSNPLAAAGGADSESMTSLIRRGPQVLKHRQRATTREDYEWLAREVSPAIASVRCLPHYDAQRRPNPGWVTVLIVPHGPEARPFPSLTLRDQVKTYLAARAANVVTAPQQLVVAGPVYLHVSVTVDVHPVSLDVATLVEQNVRTRLSAFLHPTSGGLHGQGWGFGQVPCLSDFVALVQGIDGVEHLANLSVRVEEPQSGTIAVLTMDGLTTLTPSPYMLVSSGIQQIMLRKV
jgi:predicted phage baseplate assembly protein